MPRKKNTEGEGTTENEAPEEKIERPKLSDEEKKSTLKTSFTAYLAAKEKETKAKEALDAARQEISNSLKDVWEKVGPGPYDLRGQELLIMRRGTGDDQHFFPRSKVEKHIEEIGI